MNLAADCPSFTTIGERMEAALKPKWELDFEYVENTNHTIYYVMRDEVTAAVCRRKENAAFIVRACSSHAELLASLEQIYQLVEDGKLVRDISRDASPTWATSMVELVQVLNGARVAIDKAKA